MKPLIEQLTPAALAALSRDEVVVLSERLRLATERREEAEEADPELTALLRQRVDEALGYGDIDEVTARAITEELASMHARVVFEARFAELIAPHVERQRRKHKAPPVAAWGPLPTPDPQREVLQMAKDDPDALVTALVREMARFVDDLDRVIDPAVEHARACGIEEAVFAPVIARVVRELRVERRGLHVHHL